MALKISKTSGNFEMIVWACYYLVMFTFGRYEVLKQPVIWGGGILAFALTAPFVYRNFKLIPKEVLWLVALWFWSLTGGLVAINMGGYLHYLRMIAQMVLLVIFVGCIVRKSQLSLVPIIALIPPPLFMLGDILINRSSQSTIILEQSLQNSDERAFGLANDPNAFGVMCCVGIWACLKIISQKRFSRKWTTLLSVVVMVLIYGILLSASRSAFVICTLLIVGWLLFCLPEKVPIHGLRLVIICILMVALLYGIQWVFDNTFLGTRSVRAIENTSEESRVQLVIFGLELFLQSPIIGHGLAQFVELSPTRHYAHNDFIELLATTGFPGVLFYYLVFAGIFIIVIRLIRRHRHDQYYSELVMYALFEGLLVTSGMFNVNFASMECAFWLSLLLGSIYHFRDQELKSLQEKQFRDLKAETETD